MTLAENVHTFQSPQPDMGEPSSPRSLDQLERGLHVSEHQGPTQDVYQSEYHNQVVKPKLQQRPWLDILSEFLDPNKVNFIISPDRRLSFFDVEVIHISASGEVDPPIKCNKVTEFLTTISKADKQRSGTLVLAEDLFRGNDRRLGHAV